MTRSRFLMFLAPLVLLVVVTFEKDTFLPENITLASQIVVALMAWVVAWFRLDYQKRRRELAILPALPLILPPFNQLLFLGRHNLGADMPFYHGLMLLAWLGAAIVIGMASLPDEKKPGSLRLDSVSILIIVFISYFALSFIIGHIGEMIGYHA